MNLVLTRLFNEIDGAFSRIDSEDNSFQCVGLEHAYDSGNGDGSYSPKLQAGTYTCKRSMHRLHGMTQDFETFQIMDVPGHSNILFHWGNYNDDSDGCVLLGRRMVPNPDSSGTNMITSSKNTFNAFMDAQKGVDTFTLTVKDV